MRIRMTVSALAAAVVMSGVATAQIGNGTAAPAPAPAQASGALAQADLPKFLDGMGYEYEKAGDASYRLAIDHGKWKFKINISLSDNLKKVWMSSYLAEIKDLNQVPVPVLTKLLLSNSDTGPAHFYICNCETCRKQTTKWLKMGYALDNRNMTPRYFREELDWFVDRLADTGDLWSSVASSAQAAK